MRGSIDALTKAEAAFRVFFSDGATVDVAAANSEIARKEARRRHAGGFVTKVKVIKEKAA